MTSPGLTLKLGLLALVCYGVYFRWSPGDDDVIELSPTDIEAIVERQEELLARPLSDDERASATRDFVEEEMLVREAFRRGLDRLDRRVRPLLIEHAYDELLRTAEYEAPTLTEAELQSYFETHRERYRIPERVDIQQVLLPAGAASPALESVLAELRNSTDYATIGTAGQSGTEVKEVSLSRIARAFGLEVAREIFALPIDEWHGPFTSNAGVHAVRVVKRWPAREPSYEDVRSYLEQDFLRDAADRVVDGALARMRGRYRVEIEDVD